MNDRKTMIPELLPDPKVRTTTQTSPRDRVVKQMREMLKAGLLATTGALAGCTQPSDGSAFGVVDPIPPPARCRTIHADMAFSGTAILDQDNITVDIQVDDPGTDSDFRFGNARQLDGGASLATQVTGLGSFARLELVLVPSPDAKLITFEVPVGCGPDWLGNGDLGGLPDGTNALKVTVFLPEETDGGEPVDAGEADAGLGDAGSGRQLRIEIERIP